MIIHLDSIQYIMDNKKAHNHIGFIGLGIMGKPMVKNLLSAGHKVSFFAILLLIISATFLILSIFATDVPPNFITIVFILLI